MKKESKNGKSYDTGTPANVHVCATPAEIAWLKAHGGNSKGFHVAMARAMADETRQAGLSPEDTQGLCEVRTLRALLAQLPHMTYMMTPHQAPAPTTEGEECTTI